MCQESPEPDRHATTTPGLPVLAALCICGKRYIRGYYGAAAAWPQNSTLLELRQVWCSILPDVRLCHTRTYHTPGINARSRQEKEGSGTAAPNVTCVLRRPHEPEILRARSPYHFDSSSRLAGKPAVAVSGGAAA